MSRRMTRAVAEDPKTRRERDLKPANYYQACAWNAYREGKALRLSSSIRKRDSCLSTNKSLRTRRRGRTVMARPFCWSLMTSGWSAASRLTCRSRPRRQFAHRLCSRCRSASCASSGDGMRPSRIMRFASFMASSASTRCSWNAGRGTEQPFGTAAWHLSELREELHGRGTKPIIPNRSNRKQPFSFKRLFRARWLVENAFNRLNDFRIATIMIELTGNYLASVCLVAAQVWWI
jgi:hypothetical protein